MTDDVPAPDATPAPTPAPRPTLKQRWMTGRSMLALVVSVVALGFAAAPWVSPDLFGSRVRAYLISHPEVLDEAVTARQAREDGARVEAINANVAAHPELLRPDPRDPAFGPADAKVTVIEFYDFRCPGCKAVAGDYLRLIKAHPDVRFVFKDWPILDRGEGPPVSQLAARAAIAAHQQGKYLQVYEGLMAERALDQAAIERVLAANGVSLPAASAVINAPETSRHLADIHTTAATFQLTGTPTFLINGKTTPDIAPETVLRAIEAAKAK
jgi:protein-disulfide isomerase